MFRCLLCKHLWGRVRLYELQGKRRARVVALLCSRLRYLRKQACKSQCDYQRAMKRRASHHAGFAFRAFLWGFPICSRNPIDFLLTCRSWHYVPGNGAECRFLVDLLIEILDRASAFDLNAVSRSLTRGGHLPLRCIAHRGFR